MNWVNVLVQGVLLGGFYALLACGLSLMFGVMRIINLAHGDIAVIGAYLIWVLVNQTPIPPWLAALLVLPIMWVAGYAMYVLLLERSRRAKKRVGELLAKDGAKTAAEVVAELDVEDRVEDAEQTVVRTKYLLEQAQTKQHVLQKYTRDLTIKRLSGEVSQESWTTVWSSDISRTTSSFSYESGRKHRVKKSDARRLKKLIGGLAGNR